MRFGEFIEQFVDNPERYNLTEEEYDQTLKNMMGVIQETSDDDLSKMFKDNKANFEEIRKQEQEWRDKKSDENKASAYDSPQTNED